MSLVATGRGLLFGGDVSGRFQAFDDETGEVLWEIQPRLGGERLPHHLRGLYLAPRSLWRTRAVLSTAARRASLTVVGRASAHGAGPSRKTWRLRDERDIMGDAFHERSSQKSRKYPWRSSAFDRMYRATRWDRS